jgi:mannose-6-phosphate isomerase-like protein (cupin superfamily)
MIKIVRHDESQWYDWRPGVKTRSWSSAESGAKQAHIGEQLIQPGIQVPYHWHYYEEHLTIYKGKAEVRLAGETAIVEGPATVVFPAQSHHGFFNAGDEVLHIIGAIPWPIHQTQLVDDPDNVMWVGWEPEIVRRRRMVEEGQAG